MLLAQAANRYAARGAPMAEIAGHAEHGFGSIDAGHILCLPECGKALFIAHADIDVAVNNMLELPIDEEEHRIAHAEGHENDGRRKGGRDNAGCGSTAIAGQTAQGDVRAKTQMAPKAGPSFEKYGAAAFGRARAHGFGGV